MYFVKKLCSFVKILLWKGVECFFYLKFISDYFYFFGGVIDFLIGIDFLDVFIDLDLKNGESGDLVVKWNLFGWYVIG